MEKLTRTQRLDQMGVNRRLFDEHGKAVPISHQLDNHSINMLNCHPDVVKFEPVLGRWRWCDGSLSVQHEEGNERTWKIWTPVPERRR